MNEAIFIKQKYDRFSGCIIKYWKVMRCGFMEYYSTIHYK